MDLKTLSDVFEKRIFRIPDYQRGYAWQREQLRDFWEDLINLDDIRQHYTGLLTLRLVDKKDISADSEEYWLTDDQGYKVYHVVDGQQRLTTAIILLQAIVELLKSINGNDKQDDTIYLGSNRLSDIIKQYLVRIQEPQRIVKTYLFGYTTDNPSFLFLRHRILGEGYGGDLQETFYTLNLLNAKTYFLEQLRGINQTQAIDGIRQIFRKLTQQLRFNEYIIEDDFDVYVAFETMNNRGRKLSDLELLKNRMIYLTTLYSSNEVKQDTIAKLRQNINDTWKEVYHQLGRNRERPLKDDDFLKAHWISYFKYSREKSNDYIRDLLDVQFTPKNIHEKTEIAIQIDDPKELHEDLGVLQNDDENAEEETPTQIVIASKLRPQAIDKYVLSLRECAHHWYNTYFPQLSSDLTNEEKSWVDKLNRIGMGYFRPLVMTIFLKIEKEDVRITLLKEIERFIFIVSRLCRALSNYKSSLFYNSSRALYYGETSPEEIIQELRNRKWCFIEGNIINSQHFYNYLSKRYSQGNKGGYYSWYSPLQYFLYEYELDLMQSRGQSELRWNLFVKSEKDMVSIEHILPQTADNFYWKDKFGKYDENQIKLLSGSLGNLLPLSSAINSSLQNDSFTDKKELKKNQDGTIVRNGYKNGSHSEREVADDYPDWTMQSIKTRGLKLLSFMEKRWDFKFQNDEDRLKLLFLNEIPE